MKKITSNLKLFLLLAAMCVGVNEASAWTWTGEAHTNGDMTADFYVYNVEQNLWVGVDGSTPKTYTDLTNAIMFNKISSYRYGLWSTGYTLEFDNAKRLKCSDGNAQVATANDGAKTNMLWTAENTSYLNTYRIESQDGARYMEAVGDGQTLSFPKNSNKHAGNYNMWYFISADQVTTYNNRFFYFQADPQVGVGEGSVEAQGEVAYELANYADRLNTHTQTLTFSATPAQDYKFEGWYETSDCSGNCVSIANPYTLSVSNDAAGKTNKKTVTLYAKYVQGAVATVITQKTTKLDWYATYTFDQLFESNNTSAATVTLGGETITELTTLTEDITIHVSQAAVPNQFTAIEQDLVFHVGPADAYPGVVLDEYIFQSNETSGDIENGTYDLTWTNTNNEAGIASYEYKTSFWATRNFKVYQQIGGAWVELDSKSNSDNAWRSLSDDELNPAATGIRFEYAGGLAGSAQVRNVKISRRTSNYFESVEKIDTTAANVKEIDVVIPVYYGNVHTVLYDSVLTIVSASAPVNVTAKMTTEDEINNGARDFGTYNFKVHVTSDTIVNTIKAKAHFYNAENKQFDVLITINFRAQVSVTRTDLTVDNYGTICLPLDVTSDEISALAEKAVFFEVNDDETTSAGIVMEEVTALEAGKAYVFRAKAESFTLNTVIGEPLTEAVEQTYIHGNLAAEVTLTADAKAYIIAADDNMLHLIAGTATAKIGQYRAYFTLPAASVSPVSARLIEPSKVTTDIEKVETIDVNKFIQDGKVFIRRNGQLFDLNGRLVK